MRFDPEEAIRADWGSSFDRLEVVELPDVENRYLLGTSLAERLHEIALRGTTNLRNAVFDVEFLKEEDPLLGVRLHSGFAAVAKAVWKDLAPRLGKGFRLRVYGHSLGAAEAVILGMIASREGYAVELVVASGPPKVTDAAGWAAFAGLPVRRIANALDPVPFLPPAGLVYGKDPYVQGGPVLLLLDPGWFTVQESPFFDSYGAGGSERTELKPGLLLPRHSVRRYLSLLEGLSEAAFPAPPAEWRSRVDPSR